MTPDQYRHVIEWHGLEFTAALAHYLIKLDCYRWAERQLKSKGDVFYDAKFKRELLSNHNSAEVWEALAKCRRLRSRQSAPSRVRLPDVQRGYTDNGNRAGNNQGMSDLPLFGGLK